MPLSEPDPARWREQVLEMLSGLRRVLGSHRDLALTGMGRVPTSPNTLRAADALVATLRVGGLDDNAIALGFDQLVLYVCAYEESLFSHSGMEPDAIAEYYAQVHAFFEALPAAQFPALASIAAAMTGADDDERFNFGIDVLLSGMQAVSWRSE